MTLPAEERIFILADRIENLQAGKGDYSDHERAWAIADAEEALALAMNELRRTVAREGGEHVYH